MDRAGAEAADGSAVGWGRVTLVAGETITGVELVELDHRLIARHLGHDAGGHDRRADTVPAHDCHLRDHRVGHIPGINQQVFGRHLETSHSACGGEVARPQQTQAVHLGVVDGADRDRHRPPADGAVEALALVGRQELRVVEARDPNSDRKHDGAAHHGARERTHAHLVNTGHDLIAHGAGHAFVSPKHVAAHLVLTIDARLREASLKGPGSLLGSAGPGLVLCVLGLRSRRHGHGCGHRATPLADAGLPADLAAQVIEATLAHVAMAQDVDLVDARRVDHEGPLNADTVRYAPNREVLTQAAARDPDDSSFEHLDPLSRALDDFRVDLDRVACTKRRDLVLLLLLLELLDDVHDFFNSLICEPCLAAACWRRHSRMRAWSPERSTSGTPRPRYSAGLVNCGQPDGSLEKVSCMSDSGSPTTPGTSRATASISTMAGISPPLRT